MYSSKIKRVTVWFVPVLLSRCSKSDFFLVHYLRFLLLLGQPAILTPLKCHHALPATAAGEPSVAACIRRFRWRLMAWLPPILMLTRSNNFVLEFTFFLFWEWRGLMFVPAGTRCVREIQVSIRLTFPCLKVALPLLMLLPRSDLNRRLQGILCRRDERHICSLIWQELVF